jgi:NADH-quinone oxidoreductase subunit H
MNFIYFIIFNFLSLIIPVLISVAFLTLFERKILGSIQRRRGPNVLGFFGLLQPFVDGLKLFLKETVVPSQSSQFVFLMAPLITLTLSLLGWTVIPFVGRPFNFVFSDIDLGLLYIFAISSLNVYGIIIAGWSSNSKYAFLGSLRSAAQMVSYEVSIGLIMINILFFVGSLNFTDVVYAQKGLWFVIPFFPIFLMFFVSSLAETNRPPFDLPEAEAELVAGYNVEYSAVGFAFFFIGEYANIILMSSIIVIFFFGGWYSLYHAHKYSLFFLDAVFFSWKLLFFLFLFVCVRACVPRYRYDQLMSLGWKFLLPLSLSFLFLNAIFFVFFYFYCFSILNIVFFL